MSDPERHLDRLFCELGAPEFDADRVECLGRDLAASMARLSRTTPRAELERIRVLHAALRALVERRRVEAARSLDSVVRARARIARLTRPEDARTRLDVDA